MRISFDKFRQIFWMVIAIIFTFLLAFYAFQNLYSYKAEEANAYAVTVMSRINKITGKKTYRAFTAEWETKWTTIVNLSNEIKNSIEKQEKIERAEQEKKRKLREETEK